MSRAVSNSIRWFSIPTLLVASMFSRYAASGEHLVDFVICFGAIILFCRTAWMREYYWGAGFLAVLVVFSPLSLAVKIFLLMAFTCIAAFVALLMALQVWPGLFRINHPLPHEALGMLSISELAT